MVYELVWEIPCQQSTERDSCLDPRQPVEAAFLGDVGVECASIGGDT